MLPEVLIRELHYQMQRQRAGRLATPLSDEQASAVIDLVEEYLLLTTKPSDEDQGILRVRTAVATAVTALEDHYGADYTILISDAKGRKLLASGDDGELVGPLAP